MAKVRFKGEGGLRWTGPSGKTYTLTSFGLAIVTDERDLKQLTILGDFDITYMENETTPKMPSEIPNIIVKVPETIVEETKEKTTTRRGRKK